MGTSRYTNYQPVNWDIPIWSPDWKQVDNLLTNQEQGYQLAQAALNAPIDSSNLATDPMVREQLRLNRQQAEADLAKTYAQPNGLHAGNQALQSYLRQIQQEKQPGGVEYQLLKNKTDIEALQKQTEAKESWSPEKKQAWLQDNLSTYKGAVSEGELKGFSGKELSKYVDGITKADKIAKEMIPKTTEGRFIAGKIDQLKPSGRDLYADEYGYLHWDEATGVKLTPEEIMVAVKSQMDLDPEWIAYNRDNSRIELFQGGVTEKTWQQPVELKKQDIASKLEVINNSKDDRKLVAELKGMSISELSKYTDDDIKLAVEGVKATLRVEQLKLNNVKSFNDLITYHGNQNTEAISDSAGNIYKRDDLKVSPKNLANIFGKLMIERSFKKEDDAKENAPLNPNDYWWASMKIFNTKLDSEFIQNNNEYKELTTNFKEDAKQSSIILTNLTNTYNDALKNPKNETGNLLRKAGHDFDKDGKFFDYEVNPSTGTITLKEPDWNKLNKDGKLTGAEFQKLAEAEKLFREQAVTLNTLQNNNLSRILLYQTKTGDLNITDNLQDITEDYRDANGNIIKNGVSYKQIQEVDSKKYKKPEEIISKALKYNKDKPEDRKNLYEEYILSNPSAKNSMDFSKYENFSKTATYILNNPEAIKSIRENESTTGEIGYATINKGNFAILKDFVTFIDNKYSDEIKKNTIPDLLKEKKEATYNSLMRDLDELTLTTVGREYYMNALAYSDTKSQNAIRGKQRDYAEQVMNNIKTYSSSGQVNALFDIDNGITAINDQNLKNDIVEAMTKMRLPDPDNPDKLQQLEDKAFTFNIIEGKAYGVAKIIFDKEKEFNGVKKKSIAVGFEIDNTMPQLYSWLMENQQLASEFELQQQKQISNDLKSKTVAKVDYPIIGGSNLKATISETVTPSAKSTGMYSINLFENTQDSSIKGQSDNIIKLNTNNPYFPTELGNYIVNLERKKDDLALIKELKFNNNESLFKNYIISELKTKESNLGDVQLNAIYDRFIQPRIKNGKSPTLIPSPGNFTNPQGFQW